MTIEQKSSLMLFPRIGKYVIIVVSLAFIVVGVRAYQLYRYVFEINVQHDYILLIPDNKDANFVYNTLIDNNILINQKAFRWVAKKKEYKGIVKPGRYSIEKGMTTNSLVNMLRSGDQSPVKITFNNVRFKEELAGKVSKYIQADSTSILRLFSNEELIQDFGFETETFRAMFIPNTYEMYWTTTADEFAKRMKAEYDRFWNDSRLKKASTLGLKPVEVITLASIVQSETIKQDELKVVAGLYINRLNKGMLLQADPTIKYAVGDYSLKRVLTKHLEIDSPYNTYKNAGLPPGPIAFPEITSIDAVLNYEKHKYLFMCAKEDFSGYHNFARTLGQHNRNAEKYRKALDKNRIWK